MGLPRWKAHALGPILRAPILQGQSRHVVFVRDGAAAARLSPTGEDCLAIWGPRLPPGLAELARTSGAELVHIEDGFLRSVGLGSDFVPPRSIVCDRRGLYCDATRPSDLEDLLAHARYDPLLLARAALLRERIVVSGLTKYNSESLVAPAWAAGGRPIVLVPGQVESDASIALGAGTIRTNLALLAATRAARPEAFIVYKPHPDVAGGNRRGRLARRAALAHADHVETSAGIVSCLRHAQEVHTITSLAGFDALLRGVPVVCWGVPFYAGWGLTQDRAGPHPAFARRASARGHALSLDELVAGALLLYPLYWDSARRELTRCETVVSALARDLAQAQTHHAPGALGVPFLLRQMRRLALICGAWTRSP